MDTKAGPPKMLKPLQTAAVAPTWPRATPPHRPWDREAGMLQVLGALAVLWLGSMALTYLLWQVALPPTWGQVHPKDVPGFWGHGSSPAWEPLEADAGQQRDSCRLVLVESIPQDLPSAAGSPSAQPLGQAWLQLLDTAQESVHVASYYWSLTGPDIGVNDSSSQLVKELGAVIYNCSHLAQDLEKTFQTYWVLGAPEAVLPKTWPQNFSSDINRFQPFRGLFDGMPTAAYFSASPPVLCPRGRTPDLEALLAVMGGAQEFIYASVMEYFPTTRFSHPRKYWPVLDNALRAAAFAKGVRVRLLVGCGLNTDPAMFPHLRSLQALSDPAANVSVDVRVFIVPVGNHSNIPFSRVNHSKFMVTDKAAYIGTSNWSEDYFSSTAGVGLVVAQSPGARPAVQEQLRLLFERDWGSRYAVGLDGLGPSGDCVWRG
ncbi:5'-3' exonuclease PLD4 isoform X5 [Callithrix jacchus]